MVTKPGRQFSSSLFHSSDPEAAARWLLSVLGVDRLRRKVAPIFAELKSGKRHLRSALESDHVPLMLGELAGIVELPLSSETRLTLLSDMMTFSAAAQNLHSTLSASARDRHAGMLKQAMDTDVGFAPIRTEYLAANLGLLLGAKVTSVDLEGCAQFDFLFEKDGEAVEVECKLLSHDFGNPFSRSRFDRLIQLLGAERRRRILAVRASRILWISLDGDLPRKNDELEAFAEVIACLAEGAPCETAASLGEFRMEDWPPGLEDPGRAYAEARFLTSVHHCATLEYHNESAAFIVALLDASEKYAKFPKAFFRRFKGAADQLSGERPGVIFAEVQGPCPDRANVELIRGMYARLLPEVFKSRPFLELVILAFAGPPFTAGITFPLRNSRRKRRNQLFLMKEIESLSVCRTLPAGSIPNFEFRQAWWREKFDWSYKSDGEIRAEIGRAIQRLHGGGEAP